MVLNVCVHLGTARSFSSEAANVSSTVTCGRTIDNMTTLIKVRVYVFCVLVLRSNIAVMCISVRYIRNVLFIL